MPLIMITGIPCSGKTTRSLELKSYFEEKLKSSGQNVEIISENNTIIQTGYNKNVYFAGNLKSKMKDICIQVNVKYNFDYVPIYAANTREDNIKNLSNICIM